MLGEISVVNGKILLATQFRFVFNIYSLLLLTEIPLKKLEATSSVSFMD